MGAVYAAVALFLGGILAQKAWQLMQAPADLDQARSLFKYSILYMMLLCAGMVVDSLPVTHQLLSFCTEHLQSLVSAIPMFQGLTV